MFESNEDIQAPSALMRHILEGNRQSSIDRYEPQYEKNKKANVGDIIQCAVCRTEFKKIKKAHVFCTHPNSSHKNPHKASCSNKYWGVKSSVKHDSPFKRESNFELKKSRKKS
mgnify:CR=1 FL=1|tara:strand:- start:31902 stop:32240 length:339 start_codon:yes stop_codon:yes gene_type:complete